MLNCKTLNQYSIKYIDSVDGPRCLREAIPTNEQRVQLKKPWLMTLCPGAKRNVVQTRGSLPEEGFRGFSRRPCWRAETVLHENRSYYLGETKSSNMAAMTSQENALYYCPLSTVIREFKDVRANCLCASLLRI